MRINPDELHINDPEYYDELYCGPPKRRDRWAWSAKMFGLTSSILGTVPHEHHRIRRAALSPYFSKRSVVQLEPIISSLVEKLCDRFRDFQRSSQPLELGSAYAALTTDIITEYWFARSYGFLDKPDFMPEWVETWMAASESAHLIKQCPWLVPVMQALPNWFGEKTIPGMMQLINLHSVRLHLSTFMVTL